MKFSTAYSNQFLQQCLQQKPFILMAFILLISISNVNAQCLPSSTTQVTIGSATTTTETCPQNGTITVNSVSGGGNVYVYEIVSGPIIRGIQSQNVFSALSAGTYVVRVTGCNGKFKEIQATVGKGYVKFGHPLFPILNLSLSYVKQSESYKCGVTNNGSARVMVRDFYTSATLSDSVFKKRPYRYQVSTNSDPYTGFNGVPYNTFSYRENGSYLDDFNQDFIDTISNLSAGVTYYIRVTDACGVYETKTLNAVAAPPTNNFSYNFEIENPYSPGSNPKNYDYTSKGNCVQMGRLRIFNGATELTTVTAINAVQGNYGTSAMPINVTITRQDNNQVIATRRITRVNSASDITFDSIPRIPVNVKITDTCGFDQTFAKTALSIPSFNLQAFNQCLGGIARGYINTYNAAASFPATLKIYDAANVLLHSKTIYSSIHYLFRNGDPLPSIAYNANFGTILPAYGIYRIVLTDNCNRYDSITHDFQPGAIAGSTAPTYSFKHYTQPCAGADWYTTTVTQTNSSPVVRVVLTAGPAGVSYPKVIDNYAYHLSNATAVQTNFSFFDSLKVGGPYTMVAYYGCGESANFNFTIAAPLSPVINASLSFNPGTGATCYVDNTASVGYTYNSGTDFTSMVVNQPYIRIVQAPVSWLNKISTIKAGVAPSAPTNMLLDAPGFDNGIEFNSFRFQILDTTTTYVNSVFRYFTAGSILPSNSFTPGVYHFEMRGLCINTVLATLNFTIAPGAEVSKPINIGASAAYICDNGTDVKLVAVPTGGKPTYQYQIKPTGQPDNAYSSLQTSNTFNLPASTPAGSTYTLRVTDACGTSFIGDVPVNSIAGDLFLFPSKNCIDSTARIITGYIPGATYTWTLPGGTTIVNDTNEIHIPNFSAANIGNYSVSVNALNGCIMKSATRFIGADCELEGPLPVKLTQFTARKNAANQVDVKWQTAMEMNNKHFEVQRSTDAVHYTTIAIVNTKALNGNSAVVLNYAMEDATAAGLQASQIYYRLNQVDKDGKASLSKIETVRFNDVSNIEVYPNPLRAGELLNIKGVKVGSIIRLYNATGQMIITQKATAVIEKIMLPMLNSGVYHLQVASADGTIVTKKVIRQ